ncbi:MAG TPA: hypothetical protein VFR76_07045 [Verrucomicrobiae bacterium]|nr:hypothetical protein [Verrucomicrobiae bacterium]
MPEPELSLLFVRPLNRLGARYIVSGGIASILYGEPRLTNDVDIVVFLRVEDIPRWQEVFPSPEFYVPPTNAIAAEIARPQKGQFNVIHSDTGFKADFYTAGRDELNAWGFRNSRRMEYRGEPIVLAPPEYVIVRKLEFYREGGSDKHLRDIRSMLAVSGEQINRAELDGWIRGRGLETQWKEVGQ